MKTLLFSCMMMFLAHKAFSATSEKDCSFIDLGENGLSMNGIEVDNQGRNGLCYAYAASHMIDAWRRSHNIENLQLERISPIAAGLLHSSIKNAEDHDGGSPCNLINTMREEGICGESRVPGTTESGMPTTKLLDILEVAYQSANKISNKDGPDFEQLILDLQKTLADIGHPAPLMPVNHLKVVISRIDEVDFIRGVLLQKNCHPYKFAVDVPQCQAFKGEVGKPTLMLEKWDKLLEKENPQPIGINYNSGVLKNKKGGGHASLVVGRRWKNNRCEYLVHNSWGKSCSKYPWECEDGRIWIPGETLAAKVGGGYWIIKK